MAKPNKWRGYVAECPHCGLPFGVMVSNGLHAVGGLVLTRPTPLRCWNPHCAMLLSYRPCVTPVLLPARRTTISVS